MSNLKSAPIQAFLQARMSSRRLPGKVLATVAGKPLFLHAYERVSGVLGREAVTVLTSTDVTDDPLRDELERRKIPYFRGALDDVLARFAAAAAGSSSTWFMRISCDSPLIAPETLRQVMEAADENYDLITNVFPRTFPKGQSVELLHRSLFAKLAESPLKASHREHVTSYVYENPDRFRIRNVSNPRGDESGRSDVVDTPDDLERVRRQMEKTS